MGRNRKQSNLVYVWRILTQVVRHPANRHRRGRAVVRALWWQARKRVVRTPVDVPFEGFVLRCHPDSNSASNVIYFTARFDHHEMAFLRRYLREGDGFLDVGANIGTYTLLAASLLGGGSSIVAIEPLPRMARYLRENLALNGLHDVTVHEVAVSDRNGTVTFLDFDVSSQIAPPGYDAKAPDGDGLVYGTQVEVAQQRLDDLVGDTPFALGKLDVEGAELMALQGAEAMLVARRPPVWMVELMSWQLARMEATPDDVLELMAAHGYLAHRYDADSGTLDEVRAPIEEVDYGNFWFIAEDHLDAVRDRLAHATEQPARR